MTEETLFAAALQIEDPIEREELLSQHCAGNPELRKKVDAIFEVHAESYSLLGPSTDAANDEFETRHSDVLKVRCPHCHTPLELAQDVSLDSISCSSCGCNFSLVSEVGSHGSLAAGSEIGHFRLVERVGVGGFGAVWKANDSKLGRTVAVKIPRKGQFDSQQERDFLREAQNAAQLKHPGIVPVYEVGRDGDTLFIVSDFIEGMTLNGLRIKSRPCEKQLR